MGKTLGIGMIEMYTKMVREEFAPIISNLNARREVEKHNTEVEVRKELGIYNMTVKRMKLKAELDELDRQLKSYEQSKYYGKPAKIDKLVNAKMEERKNGLLKETEVIQRDLIHRIKLAGVAGDVKTVFDDLPKMIEPLQKKLKALPATKKVKKLTI